MEAKYKATCRAAVRLHALLNVSSLNDNPNSEYILNDRTSFLETNHIIIKKHLLFSQAVGITEMYPNTVLTSLP
jgi:hypothetical protein